jgi:sigma-B regulation protein RsbU (phosphoserine phosphatase)
MAKDEPSNFSKRLTDFSARFEEHGQARGPTIKSVGVLRTIMKDLRDLFTKDVTRAGLRDLVKRDAQETFRFYTRTVDLESLEKLRWFRRYPAAAWKVFVALAHRLSPPRRIAFAISVFSGLTGLVLLFVFRAQYSGDDRSSGIGWLLIAFAGLFMLLLMELRDKLDLKGDLEIAREIQFGLIPSEPFSSDGTRIHGYMRPANTVGGDYYDIIRLDENLVGVVVGDVAGKGIPAALLMALLLGSLRTLISAGLRGSELITKLNKYLCSSIPANRLVTLFYGELDTRTGNLHYINGGHNPPFLLRHEQSFERLPATAMVLGVDSNIDYKAEEITIRTGDSLLLFTDGLTEAFNAQDEEYGEERLASFLHRHSRSLPTDLINGLVEDALSFCGAVRPTDDITMMLITRPSHVSPA